MKREHAPTPGANLRGNQATARLITVGKHKGKTTSEVLFEEPAYAIWVMDQAKLTGPLVSLRRDLMSQMTEFDELPFKVKCASKDCDACATYAAVYKDSVDSPTFWCDDCDPYELGAPPGALGLVRNYRGAILHIDTYCTAKVTSARSLMKVLTRAKR